MKICPSCKGAFDNAVQSCPTDGHTLRLLRKPANLVGCLLDNRYRVVRQLGRGGMGDVYLGQHSMLQRPCALKLIDPAKATEPEWVRRFWREASNASRISHVNVCQVYDFALTDDGLLYIAMELIGGRTLGTILFDERSLELMRAADIVGQAASGLSAAHRLGIVHRDIKPENIMISPRPDQKELVKILDFGIAKVFSDSDQDLTQSGAGAWGTRLYMSPEQLQGRETNERTDVYSLALVFYRCVAGTLPFLSGAERLEHDAPPIDSFTRAIDPNAVLREVIRRALARDPNDRFGTVAEFATHLIRACAEAREGTTQPVGPGERSRSSRLVGVLEGRVEAVTDALLARPATDARVKSFYSGAPLDWDIIAARADIERDQLTDAVQWAVEPAHGLRMLCVVAEPGAGKTTFAWRLAADARQTVGAELFRVKDKDNSDDWYQLAEYAQRAEKPLYLLVDDVFRSHHAVEALRELSPLSPLTVIATSQSSEYRPGRLKIEPMLITLKEPSDAEKERVLRRFGQSVSDLPSYRRRRLSEANQFLALMMEVSEGKRLIEIVEDMVSRLGRNDEPAYRAYEYLCFAYEHGVSMPETVVERLDPRGLFHNLAGRATTQGLIFGDPERAGFLRTGHPVVAKAAYALYSEHRDPAAVLLEILAVIDTPDSRERRFAAALLRALASAGSPALRSRDDKIEGVIQDCLQRATTSELTYWHNYYQSLGEPEAAQECAELALARTPQSSLDCFHLLRLWRQRGREREGISIVARWLRTHAPDGYALAPFLGAIGRQGDPEQVQEFCRVAEEWMALNPEDSNVRVAYLALIERRGSPEQARRALDLIAEWLDRHSEDAVVRVSYQGFVKKRGGQKEFDAFLETTRQWLAEHPHDSFVRTSYLDAVERKGTVMQLEQCLQDTENWLLRHDSDAQVRTRFLSLVKTRWTDEKVPRVIERTREWLARHTDDSNVRVSLLGLIEERADEGVVEEIEVDTRRWLENHREDANVRVRCLNLVSKRSPKRVHEATDDILEWLETHPSATTVWLAVLAALVRADAKEARAVAAKAIQNNPEDPNILRTYLDLAYDTLNAEQIESSYRKLAAKLPDDWKVHQEYAVWLLASDRPADAKSVMAALVARSLRNFGARVAYGRLLLRLESFADARDEFRWALTLRKGFIEQAHDGLGQALTGLGEAAGGEGRTQLRDDVLREASSRFRKAYSLANLFKRPAAQYLNHYGRLELLRGRYKDALKAFSKAAEEHPTHYSNHWGIGTALMRLERNGEAAGALAKACALAELQGKTLAAAKIRQQLAECEAQTK